MDVYKLMSSLEPPGRQSCPREVPRLFLHEGDDTIALRDVRDRRAYDAAVTLLFQYNGECLADFLRSGPTQTFEFVAGPTTKGQEVEIISVFVQRNGDLVKVSQPARMLQKASLTPLA
jgi:hypothetical protein